MFDIGFSELFIIGIVALVVIGPERLPRVARTAGHLFGRMQRYVSDVKADINREIELEDLRKLRDQFQDAKRSVEEDIAQVDKDLQDMEQDVDRALEHKGRADAEGGEAPAER
jgi:sec-independent protein translocase protein TatB